METQKTLKALFENPMNSKEIPLPLGKLGINKPKQILKVCLSNNQLFFIFKKWSRIECFSHKLIKTFYFDSIDQILPIINKEFERLNAITLSKNAHHKLHAEPFRMCPSKKTALAKKLRELMPDLNISFAKKMALLFLKGKPAIEICEILLQKLERNRNFVLPTKEQILNILNA